MNSYQDDLQYLTLAKGSLVCSCWWPELYLCFIVLCKRKIFSPHFIVYWSVNCRTFWAFLSLLFYFAEDYDTLFCYNTVLLLLLISMQIMIEKVIIRFYATDTWSMIGDLFGVSLWQMWRKILEGFVSVKYKWLYAIIVATDSILCSVALIFWGCRNFESCT